MAPPKLHGRVRIGLPELHGRIGIGLPELHGQIRIGLPELHGRFCIDPPKWFLKLYRVVLLTRPPLKITSFLKQRSPRISCNQIFSALVPPPSNNRVQELLGLIFSALPPPLKQQRGGPMLNKLESENFLDSVVSKNL